VQVTPDQERSILTPGPDPGRLTLRNVTLAALIHTAYRLKPYEYIGTRYTERFDVMAKVREGTSATQEQQWVMLQNLLAERFGLKVHREKKEMPVYALVIATGGPKFWGSRARAASTESG
jgi:uncharacterized protein (TIGR03435 family)